jgi:hypothetical protein
MHKEKVGNQIAGLERFIIRKCVKESVGLLLDLMIVILNYVAAISLSSSLDAVCET